jgi:hypothetical protein
MICTQVSTGSGEAQMAVQGSYPSYKIHLEETAAPVVGAILLKEERNSYFVRLPGIGQHRHVSSIKTATTQFGK